MELTVFLIFSWVFWSGLSRITLCKPALDARMEKISTVTMALPLVLWYVGRKETHTLQNTNMLNVMNLASLKVSGMLLARKATVKLHSDRNSMQTRTEQKAK